MASDFRLADFLQQCQRRVESELTRLVHDAAGGQAELQGAMEHAALKGGKRVRPVLAYGAALAVGGRMENADAAAAAVELIHCYSLVHDDLPAMDNDDLRRGLPTVHRAFGEAMAILAGDALLTLSFQVLAGAAMPSVPAANRIRMVELLAKAAGPAGMVAGQATDFAAVGKSLDLGQLEAMHRLKTGALIRASAQLGALSHAGVTETQLQALDRYARGIGLAFQIQDDILDVTAATETLGKPQGSDQARNKPTYTSLLGVEGARRHARETVTAALRDLDGFDERAAPLRGLANYIVERVF